MNSLNPFKKHQKPLYLWKIMLCMILLMLFAMPLTANTPISHQQLLLESAISTPNEKVLNSQPLQHHQITIQQGDTLDSIFTEIGFQPDQSLPIMDKLAEIIPIKHLQEGQTLTIIGDQTTGIQECLFELNHSQHIHLYHQDNQLTHRIIKPKIVNKFFKAEGTITSSLYMAAKSAMLPDDMIIDLIRIYGHRVDFQRDIKKGDRFTVIYEQAFHHNGEPTKDKTIIYASLSVNGNDIDIYRFDSGKGKPRYYSKDGQTLQQGLLRTPIHGARLSSNYGMRRHPVLGYNKMHKGVDFAAPRGTPIFAAGDGVVIQAKYRGSYGKYIRIRHNSKYETAYAHLHRYAKGIRSGTRVTQGQVIGYVGTTGRSTGNHLHYEVIRNNRQINPRHASMPSKSKLDKALLSRFQVYQLAVMELAESIEANQLVKMASNKNQTIQ